MFSCSRLGCCGSVDLPSWRFFRMVATREHGLTLDQAGLTILRYYYARSVQVWRRSPEKLLVSG
jgi:hypothetical protein